MLGFSARGNRQCPKFQSWLWLYSCIRILWSFMQCTRHIASTADKDLPQESCTSLRKAVVATTTGHCKLVVHYKFPLAALPTHIHSLNKNPTDAIVCRYLFTAKLLYMFRLSQHPSSGVLKTVPAAFGTGHTTCTATPLQRSLIGTGLCVSSRTNQSWSDHVGGE